MRQYIDLFSKPQVLAELSTPRTTFDAVLADDAIKVGFEFEVVLTDAHQPEKFVNPVDLSDSDDPYRDILEYFNISERQLDRYIHDWFDETVDDGWESTKDEVMSERASENGYASADEFEEENYDEYWETYHSEERNYKESQWDDYSPEEKCADYLASQYNGSIVRFAHDNDLDLSGSFGWIDDTTIGEENDLNFDEHGGYDAVLENFAEELQDYLGDVVEIGDRGSKDPNSWYVEPDSSIQYDYNEGEAPCEIVSRVYSLDDGMRVLKDMLDWIERGHMTNGSTGLHVNLSIDGKGPNDYDVLKMMLFYDENYVAKQFKRVQNSYAKMTRNQMSKILGLIGYENDQEKVKTQQARDALVALDGIVKNSGNTRVIDEFIKIMQKMFSVMDQSMEKKYRSINPRGNGVFEFRSMGGENYHKKYEEIRRNIVNFAYILKIGSDPSFKRQEYVKKLVSLVQGKFDTVGLDNLNDGATMQKYFAMVPSWKSAMMKSAMLERCFKNLIVSYSSGNRVRLFSWNLLEVIAKEQKVISKKMLQELAHLYTSLSAIPPQNLDDFLADYFKGQGVKIV